ncbi:MAG: Uma2 family endonuclease [Armatimonadaceae bacterium]
MPPERVTTLPRVSWQTYESLLQDYRGYNGARLAYDRGILEIMSPGPDHEFISQSITDIVTVAITEWDIDVTPLRSTTFRRADVEAGFEPDSCFYIQNATAMRCRTEIDLSSGDPPPDLVIEVDVTHSSLDKFPIFARIGIAEVWQHREDGIRIFALTESVYREQDMSFAFPRLTQADLNRLLAQSATLRRPDWVRLVREWAQNASTEGQ